MKKKLVSGTLQLTYLEMSPRLLSFYFISGSSKKN